MIAIRQTPVHLPSTAAGPGRRSRWRSTWPVEIRQVATRRDRREFLRVPHSIYRDDPHWVAPLDVDARAFIDPRRHPFYKHGAAAQFIAISGGRTVGRIQASDDPLYNEQHNANVGCFGLFESIDDQHTADALLGAASAWLLERGRSEVLGPIDYSTNYACGLLVDGFDTAPRVMMNHHPEYYARLLENWGLAKDKDLYAWWFDRESAREPDWDARVDRAAARSNVTIRPLRMDDFETDMRRVKSVYNAAWRENWGFVRMTDAEFDHLAAQIRRFALPELILLAENDNQAVGVAITLPDVNEALKPLGGRLTTLGLPIGLGRLVWRMRGIRTGRLAVLGVVDGCRRRGVAEMLIQKSFEHGINVLGYTGAELGWTLEDNEPVNRAIERVGGRRYKTYRTYRKRLRARGRGIGRPARLPLRRVAGNVV
jgi:hypothetical protein